MKNNTQFNKITIDSANAKKEKFPWSRNFFTTCSFGECQPIQVKKTIANSKIVCGTGALVRLAPMVAPTYGDIKLKIWHNFVGMSDLIRSYTKFLSDQPYATTNGVVKQKFKPKMKLSEISTMVLIGAKMTIYDFDTLNGQMSNPDSKETNWYLYDNDYDTTPSGQGGPNCDRMQLIMDLLLQQSLIGEIQYEDSRFPSYRGLMFSPSLLCPNLPTNKIPCANQSWRVKQVDPDNPTLIYYYHNDWFGTIYHNDGTVWSPEVPLDKADFVFTRELGVDGFNNPVNVAIAVRLSSFGARIYKILKACGFELNFADNTSELDILPIFAYYKTYFDSFGLCLYQNYESTNAQYLLNQYDNGNSTRFDWGNAEFCRFVYDLGNCFVADVQDFVSAHQRTDAVSSNSEGFINNIVLDPNSQGQDNVPNIDQYPTPQNEHSTVADITNHVYINKVNHSEVTAELLKRLYKFTNRNTIAGRRIAELLRAGGYGSYVDEQKSSFIGYGEVQINVSDVNATADSYNTPDQRGSVLGEYVGKGVGYDDKTSSKKFSYETNEAGYWVTMIAIVPNAGYTQTLDPTLYAVEREDEYQREMDGLGMEFTRKSAVCGECDWYDKNSDGIKNAYRASYGLVPRHTAYKVAHQLLSGDFALRSTRDGYLPYSVDKFIDCGDRRVVERFPEQALPGVRFFTAHHGLTVSQLPLAGNAWRFNARYPWLNNFTRIFASYMTDFDIDLINDENDMLHYELMHKTYDGFIVLGKFLMDCYAPMLAIADSYGTTDENDGHGDMTFTKA